MPLSKLLTAQDPRGRRRGDRLTSRLRRGALFVDTSRWQHPAATIAASEGGVDQLVDAGVVRAVVVPVEVDMARLGAIIDVEIRNVLVRGIGVENLRLRPNGLLNNLLRPVPALANELDRAI